VESNVETECRSIVVQINNRYLGKIRNLRRNQGGINTRDAVGLSQKMLQDVLFHLVEKCGFTPLIGFSGGKDSTVMLHLVINYLRKLGYGDTPKVVYIEVSGNTHEENVKYVYRMIRALGIQEKNFIHLKAPIDFYDAVKKWGFPSFRRRWCMNIFKRKVIQEYVKSLGRDVIMFTGDRFSDSTRRSKLLSMKGVIEYNKYWRQHTFHPIAHWTLNNVLEYIALNNIELNPLYSTIGSSGNCVYCPFITNIEYYEKLRQHYPEWYAKILNAEKAMRNQGGAIFMKDKVYKLQHIVRRENNKDEK